MGRQRGEKLPRACEQKHKSAPTLGRDSRRSRAHHPAALQSFRPTQGDAAPASQRGRAEIVCAPTCPACRRTGAGRLAPALRRAARIGGGGGGQLISSGARARPKHDLNFAGRRQARRQIYVSAETGGRARGGAARSPVGAKTRGQAATSERASERASRTVGLEPDSQMTAARARRAAKSGPEVNASHNDFLPVRSALPRAGHTRAPSARRPHFRNRSA